MRSTKEKIIDILIDNKDKYMSGESISETLDISRASVWKHIKNLQKEGYEIESKSSQGYRIIGKLKTANPSYEISHNLDTSYMGQKVEYFKTIDSTNTYATKIATSSKEGTVIIADEQTKGKGRIGRIWISEQDKGLYFSTILKPNVALIQAPFLTQVAAAALVVTFEDLGVNTSIKWPNDIILNNKKVSGILTEMSAEIDSIAYIIVGIGINLYKKEFEDTIKDIATSFSNEGIDIDRIEFLRKFLPNFENLYEKFKIGKNKDCLNILRTRSAILGRYIYKIKDGEKIKVFARDIDAMGNLIVEHESGQTETIFTGEISIRGLDSYI